MNEPLKKDKKKSTRPGGPEHRIDYIVFFFFGGVTLLVFLAISLIKCPNDAKLQIYQIILSISIGGLATGVPGFLNINHKGWLRAGGGLAVFVLILFLKPAKLAAGSECLPFNLTASLTTKSNQFPQFGKSTFGVRIGSKSFDPKPANNGRVHFENIPHEFLELPVTLLPSDSRIHVTAQSHKTSSESTEIHFELEVVIDSTTVNGVVVGQNGRAIAKARLVFAMQFQATANDEGFFTIRLPFEVGESVNLMVFSGSTQVVDRNQIVASQLRINTDQQ